MVSIASGLIIYVCKSVIERGDRRERSWGEVGKRGDVWGMGRGRGKWGRLGAGKRCG